MIMRGWYYADSKPKWCRPFCSHATSAPNYARCWERFGKVHSYNFNLNLYSCVVFVGS